MDWAEARINRLTAAAIALALLPTTFLLQWLKSLSGVLPDAPLPFGYDFLAFWTGARLFLTGGADALAEPSGLAAYQFALGDPVFQPWLYPPTYLAAMQPLGALSLPGALAVFSLAGIVLWVAAAHRYIPERTSLGFALALGAPVIVINLVQGQNGLLFGALLLLALTARAQGRQWLAAGLIALLLGKPHLFLLVPVALIAARDWRLLFKCGVTCGAFLVLTLFYPGIDAWRVFLSSGPLMQIAAQENLNWIQQITPFAFLSLLGVSKALALCGQVLIALMAAVVVFRTWRDVDVARPLQYAVLLTATLLIPPYAFRYDMVPVLGSALILMGYGISGGFLKREKLALAAILIGPAFAPSIAIATNVQIGFPLLLLALWSCQRRISFERPA